MSRIAQLLVASSLVGSLACGQDGATEAPALARADVVARPAAGTCRTQFDLLSQSEIGQVLHFTAECDLRHLGRAAAEFTEAVTFTGPTTVIFDSRDMVYTAANGDELYATIADGAGTIEAGVVTLTATEVYHGGTGRFVGATGSAAITGQASLATATGVYGTAGSIAY